MCTRGHQWMVTETSKTTKFWVHFFCNIFLNQACIWFLKIDPVRIVGMRVRVCVCVCPHPRLLITSGVIWRDVNLI